MQSKEKGITLIALIITIIILVILAAVSIRAAYNSGIIDYAINGTQKYVEEAEREESTLKEMENIIKEATNKKIPRVMDIYVKLYDYGTTDDYGENNENEGYTLVFSSKNDDIQGITKVKDYGNIKNAVYDYNTANGIDEAPWSEDRESITNVIFSDKIYPISTSAWFTRFRNLVNLTEMKENLDTSYTYNISAMFYMCSSLTSLDLSGFNTERVNYMRNTFDACTQLTSLDLSTWNTENVIDFNRTFHNCSGLTSLKISNMFKTDNVTNMKQMFFECSSLTSLNLSAWNTENVESMRSMFNGCTNLESITLGNGFTTSNVTDMIGMFKNCSSLTIDCSSWDVSNVLEHGEFAQSASANIIEPNWGD